MPPSLSATSCAVCGSVLSPQRLGEHCPRCLLSLGDVFDRQGEQDDQTAELSDALRVRRFGDYELIEEVAPGGMGVVYRARQTSLGREVAVKMILAGELAGSEARRRGKWREISAEVAKAARAVAYAHSRGVLHLDLKPSNILWDEEAGPQVTDFGLAKLLHESDGTVTRASLVTGSPSYMAPEQACGRSGEISTATDVYGLGAVLYETLAGRPPFSGITAFETLRRSAEESPAPLTQVPKDLRTVCLKCLAKQAEDRYPSAEALAEDLERFSRGEPVVAVPLPLVQKAWRWATRRPIMASLIALCVLLVVGGVGGITWQWQRAERARGAQAVALAHLEWQEIGRWLDEGQPSRALASLAATIRKQPENWRAVMYAMSIVDQHSLPVLAGPEIVPGVKLTGAARLVPGGTWLADGPFAVKVWDVDSNKRLCDAMPPLGHPQNLAFDHEGGRLTVANGSNHLHVFDVGSGAVVSPVMSHHYKVTSAMGCPDGSRVVSYGWDDTACVWDARTGEAAMGAIRLRGTRARGDISPSRSGERILVHLRAEPGASDAISVWECSATRQPRRFRIKDQASTTSAMSTDGQLGAFQTFPDEICRVHDLSDGREILTAKVAGAVYAHMFDRKRGHYYAANTNGWLHGWSLATGSELWPPQKNRGGVQPISISPDGAHIITGHTDGFIRIHDTSTGRQTRELAHPGTVKVLRFAPDGSGRFISASSEGTAHVWDLKTGAKLQTFAGHEQVIISAAWSADSRLIATASYDTTARVWDVKTGRAIGSPMPHYSWLAHLEFSPDGRRLATACRDGTMRIWDPLTGQPVSPPRQQGTACMGVRFTADGAALLVIDHDGFRFWDTELAEAVSVHYRQLRECGAGFDAETVRAIMSADGTGVFLGWCSQVPSYWQVGQPRDPAPEWLPDFLEMLAQMRFDERGLTHLSPHGDARHFAARPGLSGPFAEWAREVVGVRVEGHASRD